MMVGYIQCLLLVLIALVNSEGIGVADLKKVVKLERELVHNFRNYAKALEDKLRIINGAIAEYSMHIREAEKNSALYMANPLHAFRLISHMRHDWPAWQLFMNLPVGADQIELHQRLVTLLPTSSAHREAAQSLQTLFEFYDFAPSKFVADSKKHLRLSHLDCYHMGLELYRLEKYHEAAEWLSVAAANYTMLQYHELVDVPHWRVYEMQFKVFTELNMQIEAQKALSSALKLEPKNKLLRKLKLLNGQVEKQPLPAPAKSVSDLQQQCRGNVQPDEQLACELNVIMTPFLRLAPLRLTELSFEPYTMIYTDVISEHEIEHIRRAFELCPPNGLLETPAGIKGCSIMENYSHYTLKLKERIVDMTGLILHMKSMLVFEYGPRDPIQLQDLHKLIETNIEEVAAIAIIFLDDMPLGGAIALTNPNEVVFPRRGDALIIVSGDDFKITMCPNVVGNRLILVKLLYLH